MIFYQRHDEVGASHRRLRREARQQEGRGGDEEGAHHPVRHGLLRVAHQRQEREEEAHTRAVRGNSLQAAARLFIVYFVA